MKEKIINVVLADDHSILREGTRMVLSDYEDINVVAVAGNSNELLKLVTNKLPDVVVTDISMPGTPIFEVIKEIKVQHPHIHILILTMHDTAEYVFQAIDAGISGYLTKSSPKEELVKAIRQISAGEEFYGETITKIIVKGYKTHHVQKNDEDNPLNLLTKREKEIIELLAEGSNTKDIAEKLFLSERTVSNHRANILQKCEVNNTIELIRKYLKYR